MSYTVARTEIEDWERFIATFGDRGKQKRKQYGCRGVTVFRDAEDPSRLVNVFDWDRADVERFMADPEVEEIMAQAGLRGRPQFTWVEKMAELDS